MLPALQVALGRSGDAAIARLKKFRSSRRPVFLLWAWLAGLATGFAAPAASPDTSVLTNIAQVLRLSAETANGGIEVRIRGMVTCHFPSFGLLFVQDASRGIYVAPATAGQALATIQVGDWVEVHGVTAAGRFSRTILQAAVTPIPAENLIPPREVPLVSIASGLQDAQFVTVQGVVRAATKGSDNTLRLTIADKGKECGVILPGYPATRAADELIDAGVKVTGTCIVEAGAKGLAGRATIWCRTFQDLQITTPPFSEATLQPSQIARLVSGGPAAATANRVHLRGSITHIQGSEAYLQDGSGAILLETGAPLKEGDEIEISGFLDWNDGLPAIRHPQLRAQRPGVLPQPIEITGSILTSGKLAYSLVRLNARVIQRLRKDETGQLICKDSEGLFIAELKGAPAAALAAFEPESEVELTGLVVPQVIAGEPAASAKLVLRSPSDARLRQPPSWWTSDRLLVLLSVTAACLLAALVSAFLLRRSVKAQRQLIRAQFEKESLLEAQYRDLVHNANDLVYTHDLEGNLTSVNESGQRLLGYRTDELVRMNISHLLTQESLETARGMLQQKIADRGQATYEIEALDKYGRRLDLEVSSWVVFRDGQPFSVQGIARDVSARRAAEKALRQGEQKYRDVVETSQDLIWSADSLARWTFVNRAALRIYGCKPEELQGRPVAEREAEKNVGAMQRALSNLDGRDTLRFESEHRRMDGTVVVLAFQAIVIRDARGDVLGLQGSARDITQQKRDQENILRLAAAVEQATEIVAILDTSGRVEYVNPSFERITGFPAGHALAKGFASLIEERPETPSFLEIAATITRTGFWDGRLRARRSDGGFFDAEGSISSIRDEQKRVINYACLLRDVSRESHLQEQVRLSQKMEAIGLLAGGVAHDFNNLLQVIDGYAALALGSLGAVEECRGNLEKVLWATMRATQVTRQLLAFGRQQTLQTVDADLNELVSEHLDMVRRLIGTHIEVEFFPEPDIRNVRVDRGQMEQVLLNLCINARDAMPQGGRLMVELCNETLEAATIPPGAEIRPGPCVRLSVRDSGVGMDKAILSRIFDPFFTTKKKGKGTGLGLSVVYGIIKQHAGFIKVESEPGAGTEFKIYLAAAERTQEVAVRKSGSLDSTGSETILLAEDEPLVREVASKVLASAGYNVVCAENGQEAVEIFEKDPSKIDLLLFDVLMPRCGGPAAYLRARSTRPDIPLLLCTGYGGSDPLIENLVAGGIEILNKPYSTQHFLERVRHALDHFTPPTGLENLAAEPGLQENPAHHA